MANSKLIATLGTKENVSRSPTDSKLPDWYVNRENPVPFLSSPEQRLLLVLHFAKLTLNDQYTQMCRRDIRQRITLWVMLLSKSKD